MRALPSGNIVVAGDRRYRPIGDGVFASIADHERIAFHERGGRMTMFDSSGVFPADRVGFFQTGCGGCRAPLPFWLCGRLWRLSSALFVVIVAVARQRSFSMRRASFGLFPERCCFSAFIRGPTTTGHTSLPIPGSSTPSPAGRCSSRRSPRRSAQRSRSSLGRLPRLELVAVLSRENGAHAGNRLHCTLILTLADWRLLGVQLARIMRVRRVGECMA